MTDPLRFFSHLVTDGVSKVVESDPYLWHCFSAREHRAGHVTISPSDAYLHVTVLDRWTTTMASAPITSY